MINTAARKCDCGNPVLTSTRGRPPTRCHVCAGRSIPKPNDDDVVRVALWLSEHKHDHPFPVSNAQTRSEALRLINARGGDTNGQE